MKYRQKLVSTLVLNAEDDFTVTLESLNEWILITEAQIAMCAHGDQLLRKLRISYDLD